MSADIHSLVGAFALDAVDDLERAAVDRHLRECDACRIEVAELREAAARLADGAWSVPPPRLRENVLAAVATTRPPLWSLRSARAPVSSSFRISVYAMSAPSPRPRACARSRSRTSWLPRTWCCAISR